MRSPPPSSSSALDTVSHPAPLCSFNHRVTPCALAILLHVFRTVSPPLPLRMAHSPHSPANSIQPAHAISGRSFPSRASSSSSIPMAPHPHFGLEMASGIISCRFWQIGRQSLRCLGESRQDLLKASVSPCAPFPLRWTSAVFSLGPHHLLPQLPLPFPFFFPPLLWPECVSQS